MFGKIFRVFAISGSAIMDGADILKYAPYLPAERTPTSTVIETGAAATVRRELNSNQKQQLAARRYAAKASRYNPQITRR